MYTASYKNSRFLTNTNIIAGSLSLDLERRSSTVCTINIITSLVRKAKTNTGRISFELILLLILSNNKIIALHYAFTSHFAMHTLKKINTKGL